MKVALIIVAIVAVVAVGVAGYAVWKANAGAKVPDVVGAKASEARTTLADAGFSVSVKKTYSDESEAGTIASQEPAAGEKAAKGSEVVIYESKGGTQIAVPDVSGKTVAEADTALSAEGLNAAGVAGSSGSVAKGAVYKEVPAAGTTVPRGSVITVYYNAKAPTVQVPALMGLTEAQASQRLRQTGLVLGRVGTQASKTAKPGTVVAQSVPATEVVARGNSVDVTLAGGPPTVVVPDVLNMPYKHAETVLQNKGFTVQVTWVKGTGMAFDEVVKVTPSVGTAAPEGSLVVIEVEKTSP